MVKRALLVLICTSGLLLFIGCANQETGPDNNNNEEIISIEVTNKSEEIVISFALFLGPEDDWGEEMLGEEEIGPDEVFVFEMPERTYNLALMTAEGYVVHNEFDINSDAEVEFGDEDKIPVFIENVSESDLQALYISPHDSEHWGENWLITEKEYIPAEIGRRVFFVEPGVYDVLAIGFQGETAIEAYNLDMKEAKRLTID